MNSNFYIGNDEIVGVSYQNLSAYPLTSFTCFYWLFLHISVFYIYATVLFIQYPNALHNVKHFLLYLYIFIIGHLGYLSSHVRLKALI